MENPLSWTEVHHVIQGAIDEYDAREPELIGGSLTAAIYNRLLRAGFLEGESKAPMYSTWEELQEAKRGK